ncbi:hypothetical protein KQX54_017331 [Cotesia glomerata]|uniref:Uncharacterized protein n=1 Tax=Cotesia glomerata TaxID=32391 RepID=A0AAV7HYB7_COTGL|nr:hypothetical protein KQX54_017331 [Cotesia glomerata]
MDHDLTDSRGIINDTACSSDERRVSEDCCVVLRVCIVESLFRFRGSIRVSNSHTEFMLKLLRQIEVKLRRKSVSAKGNEMKRNES